MPTPADPLKVSSMLPGSSGSTSMSGTLTSAVIDADDVPATPKKHTHAVPMDAGDASTGGYAAADPSLERPFRQVLVVMHHACVHVMREESMPAMGVQWCTCLQTM